MRILKYLGVRAATPPNFKARSRAPLTTDVDAFIGDLWLQETTEHMWMLTIKSAGVATWTALFGGGISGITSIIAGGNVVVTNPAGPAVTIDLKSSIALPNTSADGTEGLYTLGGNDFLHNYGSQNTFLGQSAGNRTLTVGDATENTGIGFQVLSSLDKGQLNSGFGDSSLGALVDGDRNTALGHDSADSLVGGDRNTAAGGDSLGQLVSGSYNSVFAQRAGFNYTGAESSNLCLANEGVVGESNVIHIGTQGTGNGQQDTCYVAGVYETAVGGTKQIATVDEDGKLGSTDSDENGYVLISAAAGAPVWNKFESSDGSVVINRGVNSIDLTSTGGGAGTGATTFNTDVSSPATIIGSVINMAGSGVIQTSGAVANTVTTSLTNGTNGQVLIGGGAAATWAGITSTGGSITVTLGANTLNIEAVGAGGGANTFTTNLGDAVAITGTIKVLGGTNINTAGATDEVTVNLNTSIALPVTNSAGTEGLITAGGIDFLHNYGTYNTFMGQESGNRTLTTVDSTDNTGLGSYSLDSLTTGSANSFLGSDAGRDVTTSDNCSGVGYHCLANLQSGENNSGLGSLVFNAITSGTDNLGLGKGAGSSCTVSDSSNILIGHVGSSGLNNTIRIGTQGTGNGQQDSAYIAGIYDTTVTSSPKSVTIDSDGKLGAVVSGGGGDITAVLSGTNITVDNEGGPEPTVNLDDTITLTRVNATTFDTNVGAAGITISGTTIEADGTDVDIDLNIKAKGNGSVIIDDLELTADLSVQYGGTGASSLAEHCVLLGGDTNAITALATGTNGQVLTSNGATSDPSWQSSGGIFTGINEVAGAAYTLVLGDCGYEIRFTSATAVTLTIPTDVSVAFETGTQIILVQYGAGAVTVVGDGGVTLYSASSYTILYEQYSAAALIKQNDDEWLLVGDIK